jgi:segregation and condensation protein B
VLETLSGVISAEDQPIWLSVSQAARLLGRHRTRVYELVRSGDLVAHNGDGGLRVERSSIERWLVAGGTPGVPLTARNAWALIGLASADDALRERTLGLLPRVEDASRARARLASRSLLQLAPRLRRRATLTVLHVPPSTLAALDKDGSLVRTGTSAALPYGWHELATGQPWVLDGYIPVEALHQLEASLAAAGNGSPLSKPALLRAVDGLWPFPAQYQIAPQPLVALDLLDYPNDQARRRGRELLMSMATAQPTTVARRSARARALVGPLAGRAHMIAAHRPTRPVVDDDPRADTSVAAAHIVGILWVTAGQGATVKELRAATGMTRERLEAAYEYLLEHPPIGLAVQRHHEELALVSAPGVGKSIERHLGNPRPEPLSNAATEVLAIVAYKQPITRASVEHIRGTSSDSALDTLLIRGLVELDQHHLLVTTREFLDFAGLSDLADLPPLMAPAT